MSLVTIRALFCPGCGAPLDPGEQTQLRCAYCDSVLRIQQQRVSQTETSSSQLSALDLSSLPLAELFSSETGRFELSVLEQTVPGTHPDRFTPLGLSGGRFALVNFRLIDEKGRTVPGDLDLLAETVKTVLEEEEDPGLAAYQALEVLTQGTFEGRLEIAIALFCPERSSVTAYNAGCQNSLWWVSSEEGRVIDVFRGYPALERKMLRQANDHFSNCAPCYLATNDLIVTVSAAYAGRGGGSYTDGTRALLDSLNHHLGEHPLRVVTLAKNAYWEKLSPAGKEKPLSGPLRVAAVRAVSPRAPVSEDFSESLQRMEYGSFEAVFLTSPSQSLALHPLHDERCCILWVEGASAQTVNEMTAAVLDVLDRRDHGDNENPREAGRRALARANGESVRLLVLQLFPQWGRAKWFRAGWHQPLCLGPRGTKDVARAQMFDEGGEASLDSRARMLFTGDLPLAGPAADAAELARQWHGGKASALYDALFSHWRTTKGQVALKKLATAACADRPGPRPSGLALVTRI